MNSSATPRFTSRFEQRLANLAERRVQVLLGELALAAQVLECALQLVCKCFKHERPVGRGISASAQFLILGDAGNPVKRARNSAFAKKKAAAVERQPWYLKYLCFSRLCFGRLSRVDLLLALGCFLSWFLGFFCHWFSPSQDLPVGMAYLIRNLGAQVHRESHKFAFERENSRRHRSRASCRRGGSQELPIKIPTTNTSTPPTTT